MEALSTPPSPFFMEYLNPVPCTSQFSCTAASDQAARLSSEALPLDGHTNTARGATQLLLLLLLLLLLITVSDVVSRLLIDREGSKSLTTPTRKE